MPLKTLSQPWDIGRKRREITVDLARYGTAAIGSASRPDGSFGVGCGKPEFCADVCLVAERNGGLWRRVHGQLEDVAAAVVADGVELVTTGSGSRRVSVGVDDAGFADEGPGEHVAIGADDHGVPF